jgi:hypothetical protein
MRIHAELTLLLADFAVTMFSKFESLDLRKITVFLEEGTSTVQYLSRYAYVRELSYCTGIAGHRH